MKWKFGVNHLTTALGLFLCLTYGQSSAVNAQPLSCNTVFTSEASAESKAGAQFLLSRKTPDHTAPEVTRAAKAYKQLTGKTLAKPIEKIQAWLERYNTWLNKTQTDSRSKELLIATLYKEFVIPKAEIPEAYYELQVRIYSETGRGELKLTHKNKEYLAEVVVADQKSSLKTWIDTLLLSPEFSHYPMWSKIWAFQGMTKLGKYDFESGEFSTRTKGQTAPFPTVDKVALQNTLDAMIAKVENRSLDQITDPKVLMLLESSNFGKIFGRSVFTEINRKLETLSIDGKWIKYDRGSDPKPLVDSLVCKNTGWCTAQPATAANQLKDGDFYVYYSMNEQGKATEPRIAIRMDGDRIGEVRGIAKDQNLDDKIIKTDILDNKLKEFGAEGELYKKRNSHMKLLSLVEQKHLKDLPLTTEEINFLYEINETILGFGHKKDPRIEAIRITRNVKQDLSTALKVREDQISTSITELRREGILVHWGDVNLSKMSSVPGGLKLPKEVYGDIELSLSWAHDLRLPEIMRGNLTMNKLRSPKGLVLPRTITGDISLLKLQTTENVKLPEYMIGNLILPEGMSK
ncbi:hypothetical protein ACLVWU_09710 [Bdellovibrio sp. HCB290]|uniref:hypothetical protein n=1 Tax=Bdellovibrio sp. HCB290 TaxID=3394356 RepID=UPI0039B6B597